VRFVFGYDARAKLVERAAEAPDELYHDLAEASPLSVGGLLGSLRNLL
jgi:hypothetical protein